MQANPQGFVFNFLVCGTALGIHAASALAVAAIHSCRMHDAADALEMELEEFHDFVKDAKIETRLVRFDAMCVVFAKANATNTAEAFEQRKSARREGRRAERCRWPEPSESAGPGLGADERAAEPSAISGRSAVA